MTYVHPQLADPSGQRTVKPRDTGLTMVIDTGISTNLLRDMIQLAGPYVDFVKLGFGSSVLYPPEQLADKVAYGRQHGVEVYPGGTFLEAAWAQGLEEEYFRFVTEVGFSYIEISDGTVDLPLAERRRLIREARERGLSVITEYGKKTYGSGIAIPHMQEVVEMDWDSGARYVIVEGRESGKGVGIYDDTGHFDEQLVQDIVRQLSQPQRLIWEAPQKHQQIHLIRLLGRDVNLGNIAMWDIYSLECLRRGLRSDTFCHRPAQARFIAFFAPSGGGQGR